MDSHNHTQQDPPSPERPNPPPVLLVIEQEPDRDAPENLRDPVHRVVQRPSLDVEQHAVVVAELPRVEVVAGEEHRKEEDDERVGSERDPETSELGLPRRVSGSLHS